MKILCRAVFVLPILATALPLVAQIAAPNSSGVAMGHLHLVVRDLETQKRFWVNVMGATPTKLANGLMLPGVVIMFRQGQPTAGTKGSVVNHIAFGVPDMKSTITRMKAAGANVVTQTEVGDGKITTDYYYNNQQKANQAIIMGPDDVRIELTEDTAQKLPVVFNHIHFSVGPIVEMKDWYVKTFGATPSTRGSFESADLPGVNLSFGANRGDAPTKGRSLDHIGFEVKELEAFCKKLEAAGIKFDVPYHAVPQVGLSVAFITDPWGTYIELTEGLDKI